MAHHSSTMYAFTNLPHFLHLPTRRATHPHTKLPQPRHSPYTPPPTRAQIPLMAGCFISAPPGSLYRRKLPSTLTELNTPLGKRLFASALSQGTAEAFFPLVSQFQTQSHPALCGLTSLATVLNALSIDPNRVWEHPWRWFTEALLDCCLDMDKLKTAGITMDQLARVARCQGADTEVLRGLSVERARELVVESVRNADGEGGKGFVVASYSRKSLGQTGSGHFSPVAAYEEESDSVLILDVARFKYGPHWIPFQDLFEATKPEDPATGASRGFMTFRKPASEEDAT